jgi:hypothetical protein
MISGLDFERATNSFEWQEKLSDAVINSLNALALYIARRTKALFSIGFTQNNNGC